MASEGLFIYENEEDPAPLKSIPLCSSLCVPIHITLKNNPRDCLTRESRRLRWLISKQHLFSASLEHVSLRSSSLAAAEMLMCGLCNVSPPVYPNLRVIPHSGRHPALPSPSTALLLSENPKLFLPRVEWNIHRTYSQVDTFISGGREWKKITDEIFFLWRKEGFFPPSPTLNPFLSMFTFAGGLF